MDLIFRRESLPASGRGYVHKIDVDQYHGPPDELRAAFPLRGTR